MEGNVMFELKRETISKGAVFNSISVSKFKTVRMSLTAYVPLDKESVHLNVILSRLLIIGTRRFPNITEFSRHLASLYGAGAGSSVSKEGDRHCLSFYVAGLDDRYVINGEKLSSEFARLLYEILFEPNIRDGKFDEEQIEQAKRETLDSYDAEINDKKSYAMNRALSFFCKDEPFGISKYGTREAIESATGDDLLKAWKNLIKNAQFEIFYTGDSDPAQVKEIFTRKLSSVERHPVEVKDIVIRKCDEVSYYSDEMELSQSKMVMGFRTGIADPEDTYPLALMCIILGGSANSKLFNNVREKMSLCYYCGSRLNRLKGIMLIESGVEKENIEKAREAILNEIEQMKQGNISDFEFEAAKLNFINSLTECADLSSGCEAFYASQLFRNEILTLEEMQERIASLTRDEIIECAKRLSLDTVYTLVGNGESNVC